MSRRPFEAGPVAYGVCGEAFEDGEEPEEATPELAAQSSPRPLKGLLNYDRRSPAADPPDDRDLPATLNRP